MTIEPMQRLEAIAEQLRTGGDVRMVYGEPIERHGRTVIPVAKISYGFGGGFGQGAKSTEAGGGGGGAGGGLRAEPVGVVEISDAETRFVRPSAPLVLLGAFAAGLVTGLWLLGQRQNV